MNVKLAKSLSYLKKGFYVAAAVVAVPTITTLSALNDAKNLTISETDIHSLDPQTSAVFVLTGKDGNRIEKGIEIGRQWGCQVYVTGCNPDYKETLTNMHQKANPDVDITLGYKAGTTVQNAFAISDWLKESPNIKNIYVVTSGSHITRAWQSLELEIPEDCEVKFIPAPSNYSSPSLDEFKKIGFMSIFGSYHQKEEKEEFEARYAEPTKLEL